VVKNYTLNKINATINPKENIMTSTLGDLTQNFLKEPTTTWEAFKTSLEVSKKLSVAEYTEIATEICVFAYENRKLVSSWRNRHEYQKAVDFCLDSENTFFVIMSMQVTLIKPYEDLLNPFSEVENGIGPRLVKMIEASKIEDLHSVDLLNPNLTLSRP